MRSILPWLVLPLLSLSVAADVAAGDGQEFSSSELADRQMKDPMPWVGLEVSKLDKVMRAHAAGVPEGVGFLIREIAPKGPAERAGLRRYDILWKFEEQLLVNEAQFLTLLKLREIGEEVKLSVVRSGAQLEIELRLGESPDDPKVAGISPADLPLIPNGVAGIPQVRVTPQDRVAELTRADGSSAKLLYKGDEPYVTIMSDDQQVIYDGPVREDGKFVVPEGWCHSVGAMLRSLYKARNPNWMPRRPRPRVVMPPDGGQR